MFIFVAVLVDVCVVVVIQSDYLASQTVDCVASDKHPICFFTHKQTHAQTQTHNV